MPKEIKLFQRDELSFAEKFYKLMDILITNQPDSRFEPLLFMVLNYIQIISPFFAEQIEVFNPKNFTSDSFLYNIEKITLLRDIFKNYYRGQEKMLYIFFILMVAGVIYFLIMCFRTKYDSIYSYNKQFNNYIII